MPRGSMDSTTTPALEKNVIGFREFIGMIAAVMALTALAIDSMLPALPAIAQSFHLTHETQSQYIFTSLMLGFGLAQLCIGVLSDKFGRRGLMLGSLAAFAIFSFAAAFAPHFYILLIARFFQGAAAAGGRVLVNSIVRDLYAGRKMAQVMSLAQVLFLLAPIVAPSIGQAILQIAPWRWIFIFIGLTALMVLFWVQLRLPETLQLKDRLPLTRKQLVENFRIVATDRQSVGYTLAAALMVGGLFGFLNSVQPIFSHVFKRPDLLGIIFGFMATGMGLSSYFNARIVERFGMRRISHSAVFGFIFFSGLHAVLAFLTPETITRFTILQTLMMMCMMMAGGNFNALAMEHVGKVAGTASSLQGFFTTIGAALIGAVIGQHFNNTVVPLYTGCFIFSLLGLGVVLITERGKLFVQHAQI
jgi:MFS transporter, DHA1 family, multidrug resistance protein